MSTITTFKKWTQSKPYFWLFLMGFFFLFFLVFNFGLDTFKNTRGLASDGETQLEKETSRVVVDNMTNIIEGKVVQHGAKPSPQEQFLYGYLQGKYKAVYKNDKFSSIELKENHQPIEFSANRQQELLKNVQALFFKPDVTFDNMKTNREPASQSFSYEMRKGGSLKGKFEMKFTAQNELRSIIVSDLNR